MSDSPIAPVSATCDVYGDFVFCRKSDGQKIGRLTYRPHLLSHWWADRWRDLDLHGADCQQGNDPAELIAWIEASPLPDPTVLDPDLAYLWGQMRRIEWRWKNGPNELMLVRSIREGNLVLGRWIPQANPPQWNVAGRVDPVYHNRANGRWRCDFWAGLSNSFKRTYPDQAAAERKLARLAREFASHE